MKTLALLLLASGHAWGLGAGPAPADAVPASLVDAGEDANLDDLVVSTIRSTGTAPNSTVTGEVNKGSSTVQGDLRVDGSILVGSTASFQGATFGSSVTVTSSATVTSTGTVLEIFDSRIQGATGEATVLKLRSRASATSEDAGAGVAIDFMNTWQPVSDTQYQIARIMARDVSGYGGMLTFHTKSDDDTPGLPTEVMRLDEDGNLGIGTTAPGTKLDVAGGAQFGSGVNKSSFTANNGFMAVVSSETITAGAVITANACGGVALLYAASAVTTDTTNTFTAPTAANKGCCLRLVLDRLSANITLDNNANFDSATAGDVVMTAKDSVEVCQTGTYWVQTSALLAN